MPHHVDALCDKSQYILAPVFEDSSGLGRVNFSGSPRRKFALESCESQRKKKVKDILRGQWSRAHTPSDKEDTALRGWFLRLVLILSRKG